MSAAERTYGDIVVIGGGCYGSYYLRQLRRARAAGAIGWERLLIVDRNASCQVAREADLGPVADADGARLEIDDWSAFLDRTLSSTAASGGRSHGAIVPSPLMPHLLFDWLLERARRRWPTRGVDRVPLETEPAVPWHRASPGGTHFVSFAEWLCPTNCIEPRRCPATRGMRDWSLPPAIREYVDRERERGVAMHGPLLFHCTHRAYGVGMIDVQDVLDADAALAATGTRGAARVLVGTVSHCHGALDLVTIGAPGEP